MAHPVLEEILRTGEVRDQEGNTHAVGAHVDPAEGELLQRLIREHAVERSIEIGCAHGISSLYICGALAERDAPRHLILDPYESTYWKGIGKTGLERSGYDFWELVERSSEYVLPELIAKGDVYDFAFIDGNHEFPYVMCDMLLLNRLIRAGGIVVLDDATQHEVAEVIKIAQRHLGYEVLDFVQGGRARRRGMGQVARSAVGTLSRGLPGKVARSLLAEDVVNEQPWRAAGSSMVALRRIVNEPSAAEIEHILLVDEWDRKRGVTIEETCQKFAISSDALREWRRRAAARADDTAEPVER